MCLSIMFSQEVWFKGNLEGLKDLDLKLNLEGVDDKIWEKKLESFIKLSFLERDIQFREKAMTQLVLDLIR